MIEADEKILFTKEMKKDYKILVPTMLPVHFRMIANVLRTYGYDMDILDTSGREVVETGLKYVHNDTCYPAILVIGQFISALQSGKYDPDKTALMLMQTGGGCRASNYIPLLRKALKKAGFPQIPVISFTVAGVEAHPGFKLTLPILHRLMYGVLYGDLLMSLRNQCRPYEIHPGDADAMEQKWSDRLAAEMSDKRISYRKIKKNYAEIVRDFASIPMRNEAKVRVGIVGEIFVKFSPLGNNNLEQFLLSEGAECVVPGLLDFCLYCVYNGIIDTKLYGINKIKALGSKVVYKFLINKQNDLIRAVKDNSDFRPIGSFAKTRTLINGYIGEGVKMGEGWLLTAEMLELIDQNVFSIVCTQPFGCLPNHIVGKGMMKKLKESNPNVNIVAIDYDASATAVNQQNRIKLMLANAKETVTK